MGPDKKTEFNHSANLCGVLLHHCVDRRPPQAAGYCLLEEKTALHKIDADMLFSLLTKEEQRVILDSIKSLLSEQQSTFAP